MARARVLHSSPRHDFIRMLIDNESFSAVDTLNLVLPLLSSNNEDFVLSLDGGKVRRKLFRIAELNAFSGLAGELMHVEFALLEVVETWPARCQDVVRLEANHVMKEAAELVDLAFNLDVGARILLEETIVL